MMAAVSVLHSEDVVPLVPTGDTVSVRHTARVGSLGTAARPRLCQSVLTYGCGRSQPRSSREHDEVLFVVSGRGTILAAGAAHKLYPGTAMQVARGEAYQFDVATADDALLIVSVRILVEGDPANVNETRVAVSRLDNQATQAATANREFSVLADPDTGLRSATHFVGLVPPTRAPDHLHLYDEVIYILEGEGLIHIDQEHITLRPGSCIQLPARTVHCVENSGKTQLRLVAVLTPAGSPAKAYYPDGCLALVEGLPETM